MQFENEFDVDAPVADVFAALVDIASLVPCVPGARLLEQDGTDAHRVAIKIKVGPVSVQYHGDVTLASCDREDHRASIEVKAREARGQGTATATVELACLANRGGTRTRMLTEVSLSGRAAAMGHAVIGDVSATIIDTFADNLQKTLPRTHDGASDNEANEPDAVSHAHGEGRPDTSHERHRPSAGDPMDAVSLPVSSMVGSALTNRLRNAGAWPGLVALAFLLGLVVGRGGRAP